MPYWLMTALIIILIFWTMYDLIQWWNTLQRWDTLRLRGYKPHMKQGACVPTVLIGISWIMLICYWLR